MPRLLGHDGGRMLLAEIPGEDMYEAALPRLLDMVTLLVAMQAWSVGRIEQFRGDRACPTGASQA